MRSLRLPLKNVKGDVPPAYVSNSRTRGASTATFTSSLEDVDLEKGASLLLTTPSSSAFVRSPNDMFAFDSQPSPMSHISNDSDMTITAIDEEDIGEPESPRAVVHSEVPLAETGGRPFSPPSVEPVSPSRVLSMPDVIHVTVHTSVQTA